MGSSGHLAMKSESSKGGRLVFIVLATILVAATMAFVWASPAQAVTGTEYSADELAFFSTLNHYRMMNGLQPLQLSDTISEAAWRHSSDMANYEFFAHRTGYDDNGPLPGVRSDWFDTGAYPWDRMAISGYDYGGGEIIAAGYSTALSVFEGFKNSPPHDAIMKSSSYIVAGIGLHTVAWGYHYYWTIDFGSSYVNASAHGFNFYEQDNLAITHEGSWWTASDATASGGNLDMLASPGSLTVNFSGTSLSWVGKTGPTRGKARVTLDGEAVVYVDLYSSSYKSQRCVYSTGSLPEGNHTVVIEWTDEKNYNSSGYLVTVDAFDVEGTLVPRYEQDNELFAYAGDWVTASDGGASGESFKWADVSGAAVNAKFEGSYLALVAKTGPNRGKALVKLDDDPEVEVDLYSPTYRQQQQVYDTGMLEEGVHTVTVTCAESKNAAAGGYLITVDAFEILGDLMGAPEPPAPPTRYQQDHELLPYAGEWATALDSGASGGSFAMTAYAGAAVNVRFEGSYLALVAKTGPTRGKIVVRLDEGPEELVDLYSPTYVQRAKVYDTDVLDWDVHTVSITCAGEKNPAAGGYLVTVDAVDVMGTLMEAPTPPPAPAHYEQSDSRITYLGDWITASDGGASGGSFNWTAFEGAAASVSFTGTSVALVAKTGPSRGKALIRLDGGTDQLVDLYRPSYVQQEVVYQEDGLLNEPHTLSIEFTGEKNEGSSGYLVTLDALEVTGVLTQAPKLERHEQDDEHLAYTGAWITASDSGASDDSFYWTAEPEASVRVRFEGSYLALVAKTGPTRGEALVTVDEGPTQVVDLYSPSYLQQRRVFHTGLLEGDVHWVTIVYAGEKNPASSGYLVPVDAFDVLGDLVFWPE